MTRENIMEAMNSIGDHLIVEAAEKLGFLNGAAVIKGKRPKSPSAFARFINSGWGVAAVCALVAVSVMGGIIWAGNQPGTNPPAVTVEGAETDGEATDATEPPETENESLGDMDKYQTETETETPSHVHTYDEWKTIVEPTCAEKGKRERSCDCGEIETEPISTLPHTEVIDPAVPPTITESGLTEGKHCEVCGKVLVKQSTVAATGHTDLAYEVNEDGKTCTITGMGTCTATEIYIPSAIDGYKVTRIGEIAFISKPITAVHIPSSVTEICDGAFHGCSQLTEISLPRTVTTLGLQVFQYCTGLTTATIQCSLFELPRMTFYGCTSLSTVNLPSGLSSIGMMAFSDCTSLQEISFPSSIQGIGVQAFAGCTALTDMTIPSRLSILDDGAFEGCVSLTGEMILPDGMVRVGSVAFGSCSGITSITVPEGVKQAEPDAFEQMEGLTDIYFRGTEAQWNAAGYIVGEGVRIHFGA